jgi:uncharacterized protein YdeI (YjbR/CyaY-like superfamily)
MRNFKEVHPADRAAWRAWLETHHAQSESVWLVNWKKASGRQTFSMDEALEEALCFGWIDSLPRKLDDTRTKQLLSPRKPGSGWSAVNIARVERMIAQGLMRPPGQSKIDSAKADGSWDKLQAVNALLVPHDLAAVFALYANAASQFDAFPASTRRGILEWLGNAKTAQTRQKRIADIAAKAAIGERANQWRRSRETS